MNDKLDEILENQRVILRNQDNLGMILHECLRELLTCSKKSAKLVGLIQDVQKDQALEVLHKDCKAGRQITKRNRGGTEVEEKHLHV